MSPKARRHWWAAAGLAGLTAIHWLPKKYLPFGSTRIASVLLAGFLLVLHRNQLRLLYRDTRSLSGVPR